MVPLTERRGASGRLWLRLLTFLLVTALASVAYSTALRHPPAGRALPLAAVATALGAAVWLSGAISSRSLRLAATALATVLALVLGLLAAGVPAHLAVPWHWSALARSVEHGIAGIGSWSWPYAGSSRWARLSVLMLLVPTTALMAMLAFWPARGRAGARALLALAVAVALAICGMANEPTGAWRAQGLLLALLVFAWLWLPALRRVDMGRALGWTLACALPALLVAPLLSGAHAWIPFASGEGAGAGATSFQWDQLYGPIGWSRSSRPLLSVTGASPPGLLRVTSLDRFDGLRFIRSDSPPETTRSDLSAIGSHPAWLARETIEVQALSSSLLVGGEGLTTRLEWAGGRQPATLERAPDGTIALFDALRAGERYTVLSYAPRPTAAQLRAVPRSLPRAYIPYTEFELPAPGASALRAPRLAREARAAPAAESLIVAPKLAGEHASGAQKSALERILASPYAPAYALARRLAAGAPTSYDVVQRIERYLLAHYVYDEHPPLRRYPLEAFLFSERRGYCEQFSGAMTLLLRMDGIAARVGVGFKPSVYDAATSTWTVRALDAHAWVEVFFTGIGWVSFDPTPTSSANASGASSATTSKGSLLEGGARGGAFNGALRGGVPHGGRRPAGNGGAFPLLALVLGALVLAGLAAAAWLLRRRRARPASSSYAEEAIRELEGALAGMSWPVSAGMTLSQLTQRLERASQPRAAAYVALLRELRFGPRRGLDARELAAARADRLALRRALARGRGLRGRLRALKLLPPGAPPL